MPLLRRSSQTDRFVASAALVLVAVGCWIVLRPFVTSLLWASVLVISTWPANRVLTKWMRGHRTPAALVMTLGITLLLLVPSVFIVMTLGENVNQFASATMKWLDTGPPAPPGWLEKVPYAGTRIRDYWVEMSQDASQLIQFAKRFIEPASNWVLKAGLQVGRGAIDLSLSVFFAFFLFRDGGLLADALKNMATRVAGPRGHYLLVDVAGKTVVGVVQGFIGTALVQGMLAGVGFAIAGLPGAVLLGVFTFFLSPVPFGPPLIWIPATFWLFQNSGAGWGLFMAAWGFIMVSSVDNLIRPLIISQGSRMPFILIFLGVIGGALAFGLIGVFLGPTLLVVGFRLVQEFSRFQPTGPSGPGDGTTPPAAATGLPAGGAPG